MIQVLREWRDFVSAFNVNDNKIGHLRYYLSTANERCYDRWKKAIFDQPVKNDIKTSKNIRKITTGPADSYTTGS